MFIWGSIVPALLVGSKILLQASHKLVNILTLTIDKYERGGNSLLPLRMVFNMKA